MPPAMTKTTTLLTAALLATFGLACDKPAEDNKTDGAATKKTDTPETKPAEDGAAEDGAAEAEPAKAPPKLTATAVGDWGVTIGVPEGGSLGAVDAGDASMEMPDNVTLTSEDACGYDIDLTRHWAKSLDTMYESSKTGMVDGLTDVEWLLDEKTDAGYAFHYKGKAPLGDMYGMSRAVVVGDRLVICDSGMGRAEKGESECLLAICQSIAAGGGEGEGG